MEQCYKKWLPTYATGGCRHTGWIEPYDMDKHNTVILCEESGKNLFFFNLTDTILCSQMCGFVHVRCMHIFRLSDILWFSYRTTCQKVILLTGWTRTLFFPYKSVSFEFWCRDSTYSLADMWKHLGSLASSEALLASRRTYVQRQNRVWITGSKTQL